MEPVPPPAVEPVAVVVTPPAEPTPASRLPGWARWWVYVAGAGWGAGFGAAVAYLDLPPAWHIGNAVVTTLVPLLAASNTPRT